MSYVYYMSVKYWDLQMKEKHIFYWVKEKPIFHWVEEKPIFHWVEEKPIHRHVINIRHTYLAFVNEIL
jgi:hypothetical protein